MTQPRARHLSGLAVAVLIALTGALGARAIDQAMNTRAQLMHARQISSVLDRLDRQPLAPPAQERLDRKRSEARQAQARLETDMTRALDMARGVVLGGSLLAFLLALLVSARLGHALRERALSQRLVEDQATRLRDFNRTLLMHERKLADRLAHEQALGQALRRSNQELDQFACATSHDLKAPLRAINNLAGWIDEALGEHVAPEVRDQLAMLRGRARRLEALVDGLLAYARAGQTRREPERVETAALVAEVVDLIAPPRNVAVEVMGPMPTLCTERVALQQVFMNLLSNAVTHGCVDGGRVIVRAVEQDAAWRFSVQDFGPGIAPQYQGRVFEVFQTLASRDRVGGSGIGLAIIRKVVESRGGSVSLESQTSAGSTFHITWPKNGTA